MTREEICHTLRNIYSPEIMHAEYVAIDAACAELKSGCWEADEEGNYRCSCCRLHYDSWARGLKYCPNCGAKMAEKGTMTRKEAIKMLVNATYSDEWQGNEDLTTANHMAIEALKQPEQKKGEWILCENPVYSSFRINDADPYCCTVCYMKNNRQTKYCPNCGAEME